MPRNSSGIYSLPEASFVAGTIIASFPVNSDLSDVADTLTESLATTGSSAMTGVLKLASGSLIAPSLSFNGAITSGFFLSGPNDIGWTSNGLLGATFNSNRIVDWTNNATWAGDGTFTVNVISNTISIVTSGTVLGHPITNFPVNTQTFFYQAAAPIGWTRNVSAANDDLALRVNANALVGGGGVVGFVTTFNQFQTLATTISLSTMPAHTHTFTYVGSNPNTGGASSGAQNVQTSGGGNTVTMTSSGSGGSHSHIVDMRVQYLDMLLGFKS